ncbi:MAG: hypothetical protein IT363_12090 [Methanoregulaceae archaeon]|nr:hypothetical protein [Methanoregulaceae archaeon]
MGVFRPTLEALNQAGVKYVVVGGLATVLHGHLRLTSDIDLVIAFDRDNVLKAVRALSQMGLVPRAPVDPTLFADPDTRYDWVQNRGMMVFSMSSPTQPLFSVDIFADPPIPFEELIGSAENVELEGITVAICSIEHLIRKEAAGRSIDVDDVAALRRISNGRAQ